MATVTPNFNWPVPTSTDLVKDGATAIEALGDSIDASLVDLKGGTTGQVLAKASNTDLDYTWTSPTTGDITGVTAGTGLTGGGTSGDVTVSFDVANYGGGQFAAGKNKIINGDFYWNQRAFTSVTTNVYGFDRFNLFASDGTNTYSAQTFTPGAAPVAGYEGTNFARIVSTGQTLATAVTSLQQSIEDVRTFAGQTVTVSFWAKAGSGTPSIVPWFQQSFGSGGSAAVNIGGTKQAITTSWARYSYTIAIPSVSGKTIGTSSILVMRLVTSAGTDRSAYTDSIGLQSATIDFWGIQVEAGSVATAFQTATGTIQGELAACQRYYYRQGGTAVYETLGSGWVSSTTQAFGVIGLPVSMRVIPTVLEYSTIAYQDNGGVYAASSVTYSAPSRQQISIELTTTGLTPGRGGRILTNNSTSAYLAFSAEL